MSYRDADLAAGAGHGLALDAGLLAFKVEVAHLAEIEKSLVKARPLAHAAAVHVVRQVVDHRHAIASGVQLGTRQGFEIDVVEADVADVAVFGAVLAAPAVDEIDDRVADALDGRDVQLARRGLPRVAPRAQGQRALVGCLGVLHPEGNGTDAGAVQAGEALSKGVGFGVEDEVDAALAVQRHRLVAVLRDGLEAHALEQFAHRLGIGCGVFDEFETVGAHRVVPWGGGRSGGCTRKAHGLSPVGVCRL